MRNKKWLWLSALVLFIPLITKNHVYESIISHADYSSLMGKIYRYASNEPVVALYPAETIVGRSIVFLGKLTSLSYESLYIWYIFLALLAVCIVVYWVATQFHQKGWVAVLVTVFSTTSILGLFSYGVISSMVNMYVFLLLAVYFGIRWLDGGGKAYLVTSIVLFGIFSVFHVSALYLPFIALALLPMLGFAKVAGGKGLMKPVVLILVVTAMNLVITILALSNLDRLVVHNVAAALNGTQTSQLSSAPVSLDGYLVSFIGWSTIGLAVVTGALLCLTRPSFTRKEKMLLVFLVSALIPLHIGAFTSLSPESVRAALDASTITAFTIAMFFSKLIQPPNRHKVLEWGGYMFIGFGSLVTLMGWVR